MNSHDDAMFELVSLYAAGAIDARSGECAAVRAHIAECASCREEFRRAAAAAAAFGRAAAQAPPPELLDRILASLPRRTNVILFESRRRRAWYAAGAVAAAVVIAAGIYWQVQRSSVRTWAAACVPNAPSCHANGDLTLRAGVMTLQLRGLAALPQGKQYQAWMIHPGAQPKPEPVFSPTAAGDGSVSFAEAPVNGALVAVTVEPRGGSRKPTSQPFVVAKIE